MSSSSPASSAACLETERAGRKYKGVRLRKWGKWVSEIRLPNSRDRVWLGSYDAPEKAARAFNAAFVCLRGSQAANADCLNFPGSPPPPCRRSLDPQEVQAAALSHANRGPAVTAVYDCSPATATAPSMDPGFATQQYGHGMDIFGGGGEVVAAQDEGMDWEAVVAHEPPLFSPTAGWGGSGSVYDFFEAPLPEDDDMQMDERDHAASASLWSFDPRDSYFRY